MNKLIHDNNRYEHCTRYSFFLVWVQKIVITIARCCLEKKKKKERNYQKKCCNNIE